MSEQPISVELRLFELYAEPKHLDEAARSWRDMGSAAETTGDDLDSAAKKVYDDPWEGDTRDSFESHQKKLSQSFVGMIDDAEPVATILEELAEVLRTKQTRLDNVKDALTWSVLHETSKAGIKFSPEDGTQTEFVKSEVEAAESVHSELAATLKEKADQLDASIGEWLDVGSEWTGIADGSESGFGDLPRGSS